jgi:NCAIR mutase (PurE)-related protein
MRLKGGKILMRDLEEILSQLKNGQISIEEAKSKINLFGLDFINNEVRMDSGRSVRKGVPEIIFTENKSPDMVLQIVTTLMESNEAILLSRVLDKHLSLLKDSLENKFNFIIPTNHEPYTVTITKKSYTLKRSSSKIGILTAGSSDIPIAEEAAAIARLMGVEVISFHDVGVAGVHRLFEPLKDLMEKKVKCIVVAAGMEGALPTVVSGLVDIPVIGVPTSIGYGYGGKGEGALMTMLQSCSPGLVVVNIDNGINAGATAALIAKQVKER